MVISASNCPFGKVEVGGQGFGDIKAKDLSSPVPGNHGVVNASEPGVVTISLHRVILFHPIPFRSIGSSCSLPYNPVPLTVLLQL